MKRFKHFQVAAIALIPAAAPASAAALEVQHLGGDVSVLVGTSCNVLILPSDDGTLIVDDQRKANVAETLEAVSQLTTVPVRFVIDTHWHLDHSGGNGAFAAAGAQIIAQRNVRVRRSTDQFMAAYKQHIPADTPAALPTLLYDDRLAIRRGRERVELRHLANAHTDGDTLVRFRRANVIAMGDVFFNHIFPFIDRSSGGSIQGMIKGVDAALALADEHTRIVPAHGPVATRGELLAYRNMLRSVAQKVRSEIRAGWTADQVIASHPAAAYRTGMEGEEDRFVEAVYESLNHENLHNRL
jgi:glyoxylase-like metal-dependent hydrolase (beta-lactamase superfamily II)